jgi:hypothetical protein
MAYETQVTIVFQGSPVAVTGTLWDCWVQSTGSPHEHEDLWETKPWTGGRLVFVNGPGVLVNGHAIALSLDDTTLPGKIFRSGANYTGLPAGASTPGGPVPQSGIIEALCGDLVTMSPLDVNNAFPLPTVTLASGTTITAIPFPVFSTNNILFSAQGKTDDGYGGTIGFTYTININFALSTSEFHNGTIMEGIKNGPSSINFVGEIAVAVRKILDGWIDSTIIPGVIAAFTTAINASVLANAAAAVGKTGGTTLTTLPAGVVLSLRNITVSSSGLAALPALGAYGGLFNKLFPSSTGTGSGTCLLSVLAMSYGVSLQLENFRHFRDMLLARSVSGRWAERMYYQYSPELTALLATDVQLRKRVISVCERLDEALRVQRFRDLCLAEDIRIVIDQIAARGTADLRNTARLIKQIVTPQQLEAELLRVCKMKCC